MSTAKVDNGMEIVTAGGRVATDCAPAINRCEFFCAGPTSFSTVIADVAACPGFTFFYRGIGEQEINGTWLVPQWTPWTSSHQNCKWRKLIGTVRKDSTGEIRDLYIWWSLGIGTSLFYIIGGGFAADATPLGTDWIFFFKQPPTLGCVDHSFSNNITVVGQCASLVNGFGGTAALEAV
jgi:hypothetical protein